MQIRKLQRKYSHKIPFYVNNIWRNHSQQHYRTEGNFGGVFRVSLTKILSYASRIDYMTVKCLEYVIVQTTKLYPEILILFLFVIINAWKLIAKSVEIGNTIRGGSWRQVHIFSVLSEVRNQFKICRVQRFIFLFIFLSVVKIIFSLEC